MPRSCGGARGGSPDGRAASRRYSAFRRRAFPSPYCAAVTICTAPSARRSSRGWRMPRWRPALVALVPAIVIAQNWLRLERPERDGGNALLLVALALAPAVAPRLWQRLVLLLGVTLGAAKLAVVSPFGKVEHHRNFFALAGSRIWNGFLDFYDVRLQFNPFFHPEMHAV